AGDRLVHLAERGLGPRQLLVIHCFVSRTLNGVSLTTSERHNRSRMHTPTEQNWPEPVQRVSAVLRAAAVDARIEEFAGGTPSARDAARAAGCELAQIVKPLVLV